MRVLYVKDRVVVNIVEHDVLPAHVPDVDHAIEDYGLQVGDACERPYAISGIEAEERKQARALREAILTGDKSRLQAVEAKIAKLREALK